MEFSPAMSQMPETQSLVVRSQDMPMKAAGADTDSVPTSASVQCFIPERRNDSGQELPPIPAEIYLSIIDEIKPGDKLGAFNETVYKELIAALSLVCRFFREVGQARLFNHLRFYGTGATSRPPAIPKQILCREKWREALAAGDPRCVALSSRIKSCSFICWTAPRNPANDEQTLYSELQQKNLHALSSLRFLESIHLDYCVIDGPLLNALARLPVLTTVDVNDPVLASGPLVVNRSGLRRKGWTTLRIDGFGFVSRSHLPNMPILIQQLAKLVDHNNLRCLITDRYTTPLVDQLFGLEGASPAELQILEVGGGETQKLLQPLRKHLGAAPCLKNLSVNAPSRYAARQGHLSLTVEVLSPMQTDSLCCTVNMFDLELCNHHSDWDMIAIQLVLEAWKPSTPIGLVFNFGSLHAHVNIADTAMVLIRSILKLFARCKNDAEPPARSLYSSANRLLIVAEFREAEVVQVELLRQAEVPDLEEAESHTQYLEKLLRAVNLRTFIDRTLDNVFPSLDHVTAQGLLPPLQLRRESGDRVWRSVV